MKKFSKVFITFLLLVTSVFMFACENSTILKCASISEITSAGSSNYAIKVNFYKDSRLEGKSVDIQVKSNKIAEVICWQENSEKLTLNFTDYDEWFSLTSLICDAQSKIGQEQFELFEDAASKTYIFNSEEELTLTFRVVAGQSEDNSSSTGQIIVGSETISSQFNLKIKP